MELRERIAQAIYDHHLDEAEAEGAELIASVEGFECCAQAIIDRLGLVREEERVEPRAESWTRFEPHVAERYVTSWWRAT